MKTFDDFWAGLDLGKDSIMHDMLRDTAKLAWDAALSEGADACERTIKTRPGASREMIDLELSIRGRLLSLTTVKQR